MYPKTLPILQNKVFVSYSYEDPMGKDKLLQMLPETASPMLFPRQEEDPTEAVSNGIIDKIMNCDALIYPLNAEEKSMWVYFERDFALRAKIPVYCFNPENGQIWRENSNPKPLKFSLLVSDEGYDNTLKVLEWMEKKRNFNLNRDVIKIRRIKEVPILAGEILAEGTPIIWFLDQYLHAIAQNVFNEDQMELYGLPFALELAGYSPEIVHQCRNWTRWLSDHSMFVKITKDLKLTSSEDNDVQQFIISEYPVERQFYQRWAIDLTTSSANVSIDWNRVDDLIIRLTFLIKNAVSFFGDEDEVWYT